MNAPVSNGSVPEFNPKKTFREHRKASEDAFETMYITWALKRHEGNLSAAAKEASMDRKHLSDLCKKHGITRRSLGLVG